jgi:hypothetical protein
VNPPINNPPTRPIRRKETAVPLASSARVSRAGGARSCPPLLFLSHAGVDTEVALDLAHRLESAIASRKAGLRVWIDQRDLARGRGWQRQLEDMIEERSSAFAVLLGARGAVNWVEAEVRVALSRAVKTTATCSSRSLSAAQAPPTYRPSHASTME